MKTVLTIAGFDPSSGAGVTADLAVFGAYGLNGTSAITALTVQSTAGVQSVHPVQLGILRATLECLDEDLPAAGVKVGMLGSAEAVVAVAEFLEKVRSRDARPVVVLDPVLRSSSGRELLTSAGLRALETRLLPLVDWITPNTAELSILAGTRVNAPDDVAQASRRVQSGCLRGGGVFATGGHMEPPDDFLLLPDGQELWLPGTRIHTRATHGTGCALSSAFLCGLVEGLTGTDAAPRAKGYVSGAMQHAVETGTGPCALNHLWQLRRPETRRNGGS